MISDLLNFAKEILGLKDLLAKAKRERRDRIADYFGVVATTIQDAADSFRKGDIPHGKCKEMATHADAFAKVVDLEFGADQAAAYAQRLKDAHEVELLANEVFGNNDPEVPIKELEEVAGTFRAISAEIRAT